MDDNGILAKIPGEYVAKAILPLPKPTALRPDCEVELDVPGIGRVRFTAHCHKSNHGKNVSYFWSVSKAVKVE